MTASEKSPHRAGRRRADGEPVAEDPVPEQTLPRIAQVPEDDITLLGFPAEVVLPRAPVGEAAAEPVTRVAVPPASELLVVHRRADVPGGLLLILAGIAAGVSLVLPWVDADGATGSALVDRALAVLGGGVGALLRSTLWQPLAVVAGGYALLVLGLLLFVPGRSHRALGVLAFLMAGAAVAGVLVPLADAGWSFARFQPGMWSAAAVGALGLLGALKAMLTSPRVGVRAGIGVATERARP